MTRTSLNGLLFTSATNCASCECVRLQKKICHNNRRVNEKEEKEEQEQVQEEGCAVEGCLHKLRVCA